MTTPDSVLLSDDPFGYRNDLREALADPDLHAAGREADLAAFRAALALGRCRLYGIDPGTDSSALLKVEIAAAAARHLTSQLVYWTPEAEQLGKRWDSATDPAEADELCARLLGIRMDAWAVGIAIDEAYLACGDESLGQAIDSMQEAIDRFDDGLEKQTEVLATLAGTRLLDNWRDRLAEGYRKDLPWWLDGRLEKAARRIEQEAMQTMPGPGIWSKVRRQVEQKRSHSEVPMSNQALARGFLLELAAEGIAPVVGGCAGALFAGPAGAAGGAVVGRVVEKAINFFGPRIVEKWLGWLRRRPKSEQVEAVVSLDSLSVEEARQVGGEALDRLAPAASPEDKAIALEYLAAIPEVVQQSLILDLTLGAKTVPPSLSLESPQSLLQLLPTDAPPYAAPMQLPDSDIFLKRVIGTGGFGVVYEAEMPALQHLPLAIKFCLDRSMVDLLRRERDNLKVLMTSGKANWSPKIVRLYGCNLEHATPFLVYEFVSGGTLTSYLAKRREQSGGNLPADEVLGLIRQITEALAFAHERGLVHRDLKPANVLVEPGEEPMLKLADFGIGGAAAGYAAAHSQIGRSMISQLRADEQASLLRGSGTPLYMDPEQRKGGDPNPKHDLYSLGVVWYQLLVGDVTRELHGGWDEELLDEFKVPEAHIKIIKRCVGLIKNRPANARELLELLSSSPSIRIEVIHPQPLILRAGSSAAITVRVARKHFDGPLSICLEDLPATMNAPKSTIQVGAVESQVYLEAEQGAAPGAANARIVVRGLGVEDAAMVNIQVQGDGPELGRTVYYRGRKLKLVRYGPENSRADPALPGKEYYPTYLLTWDAEGKQPITLTKRLGTVYHRGQPFNLLKYGPSNSRVEKPEGGSPSFLKPTRQLTLDEAGTKPLRSDSFRSGG